MAAATVVNRCNGAADKKAWAAEHCCVPLISALDCLYHTTITPVRALAHVHMLARSSSCSLTGRPRHACDRAPGGRELRDCRPGSSHWRRRRQLSTGAGGVAAAGFAASSGGGGGGGHGGGGSGGNGRGERPDNRRNITTSLLKALTAYVVGAGCCSADCTAPALRAGEPGDPTPSRTHALAHTMDEASLQRPTRCASKQPCASSPSLLLCMCGLCIGRPCPCTLDGANSKFERLLTHAMCELMADFHAGPRLRSGCGRRCLLRLDPAQGRHINGLGLDCHTGGRHAAWLWSSAS